MKKLMTVVGIALSGVLLWLAIRDTDFAEITGSFRNANAVFASPLPVALAVSIFYHTLLSLSVTGAGLYFLDRYRVTFADIRRLEQQEASSARSGPPVG